MANNTNHPNEERFYIALGRLTQSCAQLEWQIGLGIRSLVNYNDLTASNPLIAKLSFSQKLQTYQELIRMKFKIEDICEEYKQWFAKAEKIRTARNSYIHGLWHVSSLSTEGELNFQPVNWKELDSDKQNMTIQEFEEEVSELELVLESLYKLTKKLNVIRKDKQI